MCPTSGGGPIVEIARLSGYRDLLADTLRVIRPSLLSGGPGLNGFTESMPLRRDQPVTKPCPGATAIQKCFDHANWQRRAGDSVAFAPMFRLRPPAGAPVRQVIWQPASGDHTVPNPPAGEMYRARALDLAGHHRNDKTPTASSDPRDSCSTPTSSDAARTNQLQVLAFLSSGGTTLLDLDGRGPIREVPVVNRRNLDRTHFPRPQADVP